MPALPWPHQLQTGSCANGCLSFMAPSTNYIPFLSDCNLGKGGLGCLCLTFPSTLAHLCFLALKVRLFFGFPSEVPCILIAVSELNCNLGRGGAWNRERQVEFLKRFTSWAYLQSVFVLKAQEKSCAVYHTQRWEKTAVLLHVNSHKAARLALLLTRRLPPCECTAAAALVLVLWLRAGHNRVIKASPTS